MKHGSVVGCMMGLLLFSFLPVFVPFCGAATVFQQLGIASPPVPVGSGARAMGMGGAFIAVADDATAASWNPAGLVQLEKPEVSIVGAYGNRSYDISAEGHPEADAFNRDEETAINYVSATLPFHFKKNMVVSVSYQRLYEFERSLGYDFDFAALGVDLFQRIDYEQSGFLGALGIAGALELTPRFSLGATLNIWTDELFWDNGWTSHYRARSSGTLAGQPIAIDTRIDNRYEKFRGINFNLGLLWETQGWGRFGAVLKTPFKATVAHSFTLTEKTDSADADTVIAYEEDVELRMPISYGLGWSRRFRDNWTVGIDIYRTHWDDYSLTDGQGNALSPIDGRPMDQSSVDATTHVRIGGEYVLLLPAKRIAVPLRAGLFYDPEPGRESPRDFYGIALGAGISRPTYSCDLAYQLRWAVDSDSDNLVSGSQADVRQHTLLLSFIYYF